MATFSFLLILALGLCVHLSLRAVQAWGPKRFAPSNSLARKITASFVGFSVGAQLMGSSNFLAVSNSPVASFAAHAAVSPQPVSPSVFKGKYSDPFHPNCLRQIDVTGKAVTIVGSDDVDSKVIWTLKAVEEKPGEILVDFSPKGGPKNLLGIYSTADNGIKVTFSIYAVII